MPPAPTTEQIMKNAQRNGQGGQNGGGEEGSVGTGGTLAPNVAPPSSSFQTYNVGNVFRVSVPSNWRQLQGNNSVTFAPEGGYGDVQGASVFTHGVEMGVAQSAIGGPAVGDRRAGPELRAGQPAAARRTAARSR